MLVHRTIEAEEMKRQRRKETKALKRNVAHLEFQLAVAQEALDDCQSSVCWRPGKRGISDFGGYSIAAKRALCNAGGSTLVKLVAGDDMRGTFSDKHLSYRYEHNMCVAQRLLSRECHASLHPDAQDTSAGSCEPALLIETLCHKCDVC